jgi:hypothetical protein
VAAMGLLNVRTKQEFLLLQSCRRIVVVFS